jgi:transposase
LPLVDRVQAVLDAAGCEVWADRGYDSEPAREALEQRGLVPRISRRRHHTRKDGAASPPGTRKDRAAKPRHRDPDAKHRWPIERLNSWVLAWRRIETRWEVRAELYGAFVQLVLIVILVRTAIHGY